MASTLRLLWSVARVVWRGLARAGRGARVLAGAAAQLGGPGASGDYLGLHAVAQHWPPGLEGEVRRLAAAFEKSFCGECSAGPDYPQGRCPKCRERLAQALEGGKAS